MFITFELARCIMFNKALSVVSFLSEPQDPGKRHDLTGVELDE